MKNKNYAIFIPARYNSSRFPGKPLVKIRGVEMLMRVFRECNKAAPDKTFVLSDSNKIYDFCEKKNIPYFKTSSKCKTGTDRIIEISNKIKLDFFINVQGDEPLIRAKDIISFIKKSIKLNDYICIGKSSINLENYKNKNVPKIVTNKKNELLYISRASIPSRKDKYPLKKFGQVNLYSYPIKFLQKKMYNVKTELEKEEDIEILRFLEHGLKIKVLTINSNNHPVDIPSDVRKVEKIIKDNEKNNYKKI